MTSLAERRARFRELHEDGCFVIPNPWDTGSAVALEALGFSALATTSAGMSFSIGRRDFLTALSVDDALAHISQIVQAVDLPVNADFQAGYAGDLDGLAHNVQRCVATGVAGLSIEDATTDADAPLFPAAEAVERVRAARAAIDDCGEDVLLTARAECFLYGHPEPLREAMRRLELYVDAGADVLYAPGVRERDDIATLVKALEPKPVNVLVSGDTGLRVDDLAELGVRRVSVGSALARVAWGSFLEAARELADAGSFTGFRGAATFDELNTMFG